VVRREVREKKTGELYFRYHVLVTNDWQRQKAKVLEGHLPHATMENRIKEPEEWVRVGEAADAEVSCQLGLFADRSDGVQLGAMVQAAGAARRVSRCAAQDQPEREAPPHLDVSQSSALGQAA
jgi:hypothetical protein